MQGDPRPDRSRRAAASGRDAWKVASRAAGGPALCVLVALAARIWLWVPVTTPDSERFTLQARELAAGAGLLWAGCTRGSSRRGTTAASIRHLT